MTDLPNCKHGVWKGERCFSCEAEESEDNTKHNLNVRIARGLLIFLIALIGMLVVAIGDGIHWQFWAVLAIFILSFVDMFRAARKINALEDKQKTPTP